MARPWLVLLFACSCADDAKFGGWIAVSSSSDIANAGARADTQFFEEPGALKFMECPRIATIEACDVFDCDRSHVEPGESVNVASAGVVTIQGGAQPIELRHNETYNYEFFASNGALFQGGESLTFAASGQHLPGFSIPLVAPSKATLVGPRMPSGTLTIDRSTDFVLAWAGAENAVVELWISGPQHNLTCTFAANAGTGIMRRAAFEYVDWGASGLFYNVRSVTDSTERVDDAEIYVRASHGAIWPDGSGAYGVLDSL